MDRTEWPELKDKVAACFKQKTRAEWCEIMEHTDVCFAPVLSLWEAPEHPANIAREVFVEVGGIVQANAAPRFSRTKSAVQGPPAHAGSAHRRGAGRAPACRPTRSPSCSETGAVK